MDPISSSIAALAPSTPALTAPVSVAPQGADHLAAARFAAIMAQPTPVAAAAHTVAQTAAQPAPADAIAGPAAPHSMGERILTGMQGVSSDFQAAWKSVSATLDGNPAIGMQDMLKLQMQLVQVSVQYDLVGKAVTRSTQNIDQLVRLQ